MKQAIKATLALAALVTLFVAPLAHMAAELGL